MTAGSQQQDNGKHKVVTVCSHRQSETKRKRTRQPQTHMVRGQFAHYDIRQTPNDQCHHCNHNIRHQDDTHDHGHDHCSSKEQRKDSISSQKKKQGKDTVLTFDVIQRTPHRCDRVEELLKETKETEGSRCDANLQRDTWRKAKSEIYWRQNVATFFLCSGGGSQKHGVGLLMEATMNVSAEE